MALHFISDLHLNPERPALGELFVQYLDGPARQAEALYILGDLFELWAGDDVSMALYADEIAALRRLSDSGVALYFLCGNRDFLCGPVFARQAGLSLIVEPHSLGHDGRVLLMHGDSLCTDDLGYQRFRRIVRMPSVQWLYRHLPRAAKQTIASLIRGKAQKATQLKPEDILDVNQDAVLACMAEYPSCRLLIHGHTHRAADHLLPAMLKGGERRYRIVLSDWSEKAGEYLSLDGLSWERHLV